MTSHTWDFRPLIGCDGPQGPRLDSRPNPSSPRSGASDFNRCKLIRKTSQSQYVMPRISPPASREQRPDAVHARRIGVAWAMASENLRFARGGRRAQDGPSAVSLYGSRNRSGRPAAPESNLSTAVSPSVLRSPASHPWERLGGLVGRLGSAHAGERLNAIAAVDQDHRWCRLDPFYEMFFYAIFALALATGMSPLPLVRILFGMAICLGLLLEFPKPLEFWLLAAAS